MKKRFIISTFCAGLVTIGCGYSLATSTKFPFLSLSSGEAYTFALDSDNTPTLTNVEKEQKEVVATGLSNVLYLNYSLASNVSGGHASLATGGYISNYEAINDITSLTVAGNGTFKLGYGILTVTDYVSISLENTSYTLTDVDMNYFKLVATSDNAVVTSISGADSCTTAAEFGVRTYHTDGGTYTDKWTRLVHDVPATQAFEMDLNWTQTKATSTANAANPRFFIFDADAAYDENDDFNTISNSNTALNCRVVQFRQDWDVDNYIIGNKKATYVCVNTVNGDSIEGAENAFVGADDGEILFTTGFICEKGGNVGKPIGSKNSNYAGVGWGSIWNGGNVKLNVTYTPAEGSETLNTLDLQWHIENTADYVINGNVISEDVEWAFNMHQYIKFSGIANIGFSIGSMCNWTVLDASARGLN